MKDELGKLKNITILYCEDEAELHGVTSGLLRRFVKRVLTARDGEEGLELFQQHQNEIDMVITDISMPKMDGLEMTRRIKEHTPNIPVIVTTAYSSTDHLLEAIDIHVDKYVLKPLDTKKLLEAMVHSMLYHELRNLYRDPLTGLPTRNALMSDLQKNKKNRLVLLDIDRFRDIVDLYGDEIANKVLIGLTQNLKEYFLDDFQVYHTGLDSFILSDRRMTLSSGEIRKRLELFSRKSKTTGMVVDGIPIYLMMIFAMAYSEDGHTLYYVQRAMQKADEYHLAFVEYDPATYGNITDREENIVWTKALNDAETSRHFRPFFQPIVDTQTLQIHKYEALIRYTGGGEKRIAPYVFLEIAKKTHLYRVIIRVVLKSVIEVIRSKKIRVAVNISYVDLINQDTLDFIDNILRENPDEAYFVEFEILESEKIDNYELASDFIQLVKRYGCLVGIDDFGIGYSNFGMIELLSVDYVKIDGSLIKGIHRSKRQALIVETIHDFCRKLGIKTVAEMVSCREEYNAVKRIGIDLTQGWYISKEIDSHEVTDA